PAAFQTVGRTFGLPDAGIDHVRIRWIEHEVDRARFVGFEQDAIPGFAAVFRSENTPLFVLTGGMTERCRVDQIGIFGVNTNPPDDTRIFKTRPLPGLARVRRFVDAVAVREIAADAGFTHSDVNGIRIGFGNRDRSHSAGPETLSV